MRSQNATKARLFFSIKIIKFKFFLFLIFAKMKIDGKFSNAMKKFENALKISYIISQTLIGKSQLFHRILTRKPAFISFKAIIWDILFIISIAVEYPNLNYSWSFLRFKNFDSYQMSTRTNLWTGRHFFQFVD